MRPGILGALVVGLLGVALLHRPTLHADQLVAGLIGLGSGVLIILSGNAVTVAF
jgi:hypothetical protein